MVQAYPLKHLFHKPIRLFLLVFALAGNPAFAGGLFVAGDVGFSDPDTGGYDNGRSSRLAAGYEFEKFGVEIAYLDLDELNYKPLPGSSIAVTGYSAHVYLHQMFTRFIGMDFGAGLFDWNADATLFDRDVGSDSGSSGYFDVRLVAEFNDSIAAYFSTRYLPDISGADFVNAATGIKISF